jgi:chorismate mutase
MSLQHLRQEIDRINSEIIALLAARLNFTSQVAKEKKKHALPIHDEKREQEQYEVLRKLALEQNLSPHIVEEMFKIFIEYSKVKMKIEMER